MKRLTISVVPVLLGLLGLTFPAHAQPQVPRSGLPIPGPGQYHFGHMRRNIVPYMSGNMPYSYRSQGYKSYRQQSRYSRDQKPPITSLPTTRIPTVSGPLPSPPPGAAIIRVRAPAVWAKVWINGIETATFGKQRWFVTNRIHEYYPSYYRVYIMWTSEGRKQWQEQMVEVRAGDTRIVDFTDSNRQGSTYTQRTGE